MGGKLTNLVRSDRFIKDLLYFRRNLVSGGVRLQESSWFTDLRDLADMGANRTDTRGFCVVLRDQTISLS